MINALIQAVALLGAAAIIIGVAITFIRLLVVAIVTSAKLAAVLFVGAALVWMASRMFG
jgi:hypothetical protein